MGIFLSSKDLKGLKDYKYSSIDQSLVSKYVLKPFYTELIEYFPKNIAPNLITLSGLGFTVIGIFTVLYYNPGFDETMPRWTYFSFALEMFLYQTFDALDGLQARRTGQSSPLGELFDHTIDAINTTLGVIIVCASVKMPLYTVLIAEFLTTLNFYVSTWEEFHTKTLFLSIMSGPVEGVLMIIGMLVFTGFVGPDVWSTPVIAGYSFNDVYIPFFALSLVFNIFSAIKNVYRVTKSSFVHAIKGLAPFFILWAGVFLWLATSPHLIYQQLFYVLLTIGISFALSVGRIITAHVTDNDEFPMWNPTILFPFVCLGSHYFMLLGEDVYSSDLYSLFMALGTNLGIYGCFVGEIIHDITEYLDIGCLYIKHPKDKAN